jgi:glycosyltransferase involved in cell wall biosynthesis
MKCGYFVAGSLHYLPVVLPLMEETGGVLITFNKGAAGLLGEGADAVPRVAFFRGYRDLRDRFSGLNIDILVHPSFSIQYFRGILGLTHVQVFHGVSDKPFDYHKSLKEYDLIAVSGPLRKELIIKRGLARPERIVEIGFPKIDHFLHSSFDRERCKEEIGLDKERKTVLYSPTWFDPNGFCSFSRYAAPVMRKLGGCNVIVKPHVNILKYRPWEIMKAHIMKGPNCVLKAKSTSILPYMAVSDLMITDISSVAQEYLAFGKPMVFVNPMPGKAIPEEYTRIWRCGDVVDDPRELSEVVRKNLENPARYSEERTEALRRIFLPFDGKSAARFRESLERIVESTARDKG